LKTVEEFREIFFLKPFFKIFEKILTQKFLR
jgi:hypothetical protein